MTVNTINVSLSGGNSNPGSAGSIRGEFGLASQTTSVALSQYYRGGARVPGGTANGGFGLIATSGAISMGTFRNTTNVTTAWTSSVSLIAARANGQQVGPFNNIFLAGGTNTAGGPEQIGNLTFNGTTWATNASASFPGRSNGGACGSSTDYVYVAGMNGVSTFQNVYKWNGSAWSTNATWNFIQAISGFALNGAGGNDARQVGDYTGSNSRTFNGTSWTAAGTLGSNRRLVGGGGSSSDGSANAGTIAGTPTATTEKNSGNTFTSAGSMAAARAFHQSCGTSSSAILAVGGVNFTASTSVESGNGTAWTTAPSLNTARYWAQVSGTTTAAFATGGVNSGGSNIATTERLQ